MVKRPKPPKGGKQHHPPQSPPGQKLTVDMMLAEKDLYKDLMYKPGQVKDPDNMETVPQFLEQLEILKQIADVEISSEILDKYNSVYGGHESYEECMQVSRDPNVMILLEVLNITSMYSDHNNVYDRGWLNVLKILVSLYCGNPYTRDRIGYLMWAVAKHISPSCYFPLQLDLYYDPRLWHRPGQQPKPPLQIPGTLTIDGSGQEFGPEDDIWNCDLPDS